MARERNILWLGRGIFYGWGEEFSMARERHTLWLRRGIFYG